MSAYIATAARGHSRAGMAGTAMLVRRNVLMGVLIGFALTAVGARAAEPSAKSFVEAIYAAYKGKNGNGIPLDTDAAVKRYFEPKLAALIIKDRKDADKRGEVGTLEGDPFVDAQDWEIDAVDVAVRDIAADKASATVSFTNVDKPTTVVLDLVKLKEGWRIADITWDREPSDHKETLRGLFTSK
jgi:hypothetical protein